MESPADQLSKPSAAMAVPAPAEPCPPPLSTTEVFESFFRDSVAWDMQTPVGSLRGQTLGVGPALYFLGGLEGTSALFRLLAWLLREEFRCVLFDASPSVKPSGKNPNDVCLLPQVRQLFAVAEKHGDERFLVYGSGFGGWVSLAAMLAEPRRFRGAVLQGAYARRQFTWLERTLVFLGQRSRRLLKDVPGWHAVFEQNHKRWFPPFDAPRWELYRQITGNGEVSEMARRARLLKQVQFVDRLAEIDLPVLSLKSEGEGRMLLQAREELERTLPNCRSEFLKDTGLVPHWTHPHRVAKLIKQFAVEVRDAERSWPAFRPR